LIVVSSLGSTPRECDEKRRLEASGHTKVPMSFAEIERVLNA
jgi:hypothetical protein